MMMISPDKENVPWAVRRRPDAKNNGLKIIMMLYLLHLVAKFFGCFSLYLPGSKSSGSETVVGFEEITRHSESPNDDDDDCASAGCSQTGSQRDGQRRESHSSRGRR